MESLLCLLDYCGGVGSLGEICGDMYAQKTENSALSDTRAVCEAEGEMRAWTKALFTPDIKMCFCSDHK